jgi:hypothetical protein
VRTGILSQALGLGGRDLDLEWLILDSTVVQAHFDARGLPVSSTPTTRCRARWVYEIPVSFNGRDYYEA